MAAASSAPASAPAVGADGRKIVDVKLTLDVACPWCFIGQRRLYRALDALDNKQYDVQVKVQPFLLNAEAPTPGLDRAENLKKKYNIDDAKVAANHANLKAKGQEQAGIVFGPPAGNLGNTINALRLITWASKQFGADTAHKLLDAIESAIFEHNKDPSLTPVLLEAATKAGVDSKAAAAYLDTKEGVEETKAASVAAKAGGVKTVPNIYINGTYAADGSQTDFAALLKQIGVVNAAAAAAAPGKL